MVDLDASGGGEHESGSHESHPPDVGCDEDRVVDVVENDHVEENDEAAELTAERRRVVEHQTVIHVAHRHRYLL